MNITFNGVPFYGDLTQAEVQRGCDAIVMGVPSDMTSTAAGGSRDATTSIRACSYGDYDPVTRQHWRNYRVWDYGDTEITPGDMFSTGTAIRRNVSFGLANSRFPIVLGGDDGINYWVAMGACTLHKSQAEILVVHLDAHQDTWKTTRTHKPGAMVLPDHSEWLRVALEERLISEALVVGVRAPGPTGTFDPVKEGKLSVVNPIDAVRKAREWPAHRDGKHEVWLSIDMDVLDPAFAPGVAVPEPMGLFPSEVQQLVMSLAPIARLMSVTEVCPANDVNEVTSQLAHRLVMRAIMSRKPRWPVVHGDPHPAEAD